MAETAEPLGEDEASGLFGGSRAEIGELGNLLLDATKRLVEVPSVSLDEHALADVIEEQLSRHAHLRVDRVGDNVVARTELGRAQRVILAGHLDTVPGRQGAVRGADRVTGLGAADMKGGLAVLTWLAGEIQEPANDLSFIFYVAEEVAQEHNGLGDLQHRRPELLRADAAVLAEPTGGVLELGCQGSLQLQLKLGGQRAHAARSWMGENAIHRLAPLLEVIAGYSPREPVLDGCTFRESLQAVGLEAGIAPNVVPDSATLRLNHRYAPDRGPDEALRAVTELLGPVLRDGDELTVLDIAPAAPPSLSHPVLAALARVVDAPPRAKLGWTDVARFAAAGIPAVNFGPGRPELAHVPGEWVEASELVRTATALRRFVLEGDQAPAR
jgi:succinyl-diaminopimelate desuccinylase